MSPVTVLTVTIASLTGETSFVFVSLQLQSCDFNRNQQRYPQYHRFSLQVLKFEPETSQTVTGLVQTIFVLGF
jgi:hypothetical protein